jgi:hypothetical protein
MNCVPTAKANSHIWIIPCLSLSVWFYCCDESFKIHSLQYLILRPYMASGMSIQRMVYVRLTDVHVFTLPAPALPLLGTRVQGTKYMREIDIPWLSSF